MDLNNPVFTPPLSHRFGLTFLAAGAIPNPLDIRFQKVSGLNAEVGTDVINEGGQNLYAHRVPTKISYGNLVLERGIAIVSLLSIEFNVALTTFRFSPSNVILILFNENNIPVTGWVFIKAYPVKWSFADFDADANAVAIETMELAYTRFQVIKL
jgi:phage tail-like protein